MEGLEEVSRSAVARGDPRSSQGCWGSSPFWPCLSQPAYAGLCPALANDKPKKALGEMVEASCPPHKWFPPFTSLLIRSFCLFLPYCNARTLLLVLSTAYITGYPFHSAAPFIDLKTVLLSSSVKQPKLSPSFLTKRIFPKLFNSMVYYLWKQGRYSAKLSMKPAILRWKHQSDHRLSHAVPVSYAVSVQTAGNSLGSHYLLFNQKGMRQASGTVKITWQRPWVHVEA